MSTMPPNAAQTPVGQNNKLKKNKAKAKEKGKKGGFSRPSSTAKTFSAAPLLPNADNKLVTQAAVRQSLTGGTFIDTKFYAFSRKRSSGVVDTPRAVFANSAILRATSKYFDGCR